MTIANLRAKEISSQAFEKQNLFDFQIKYNVEQVSDIRSPNRIITQIIKNIKWYERNAIEINKNI